MLKEKELEVREKHAKNTCSSLQEHLYLQV